MIETGGWKGMVARIQQNFPGQDYTHMWGPMKSFSSNPKGIRCSPADTAINAKIAINAKKEETPRRSAGLSCRT